VLRQAAVTLEMIKFQHTVFALPFALLAAFTAADGVPPLRSLLLILLAMVGARSAAMAFNRLADYRFDAANPRTAVRALPAGAVSRSFVIAFTIVSTVVFVLAAWLLNPLAFALSPLALLIIFGYSLTKRFTAASHLVLGLALSIAPVGASIAVDGRIDPKIFLLAGAVLVWTAGFDILYSLQDIEFDSKSGLHSIPSRFGAARALLFARLLHALAIALLIAFGIAAGFGGFYFAGVSAAVALVLWQHSLISPADISRIDAAFFTANGVLSIVLFAFGTADILLR
jgi:4-hydroxybenzoate polyprenyltransferase